MARRRLNLWTVAEPNVPLLRKLGIRLAGGGHSMQADLLNPRGPIGDGRRTYFVAHPEWYGLHAGRRSPNIVGEAGNNFCSSNADAVAELGRNRVNSLREGPLARQSLDLALDGVRGVAVLFVVCFHYSTPELPSALHRITASGWRGVDLFLHPLRVLRCESGALLDV